ncbi:hypothetical protein DIPPA_20169 [Diplonema papillatum]|nr:hypothetical protein DIPPA_20169 [Diplonema papillatum]KAJ9466376.1 hypothetical protein DIPPA_20169 [Diplonema papillatum]
MAVQGWHVNTVTERMGHDMEESWEFAMRETDRFEAETRRQVAQEREYDLYKKWRAAQEQHAGAAGPALPPVPAHLRTEREAKAAAAASAAEAVAREADAELRRLAAQRQQQHHRESIERERTAEREESLLRQREAAAQQQQQQHRRSGAAATLPNVSAEDDARLMARARAERETERDTFLNEYRHRTAEQAVEESAERLSHRDNKMDAARTLLGSSVATPSIDREREILGFSTKEELYDKLLNLYSISRDATEQAPPAPARQAATVRDALESANNQPDKADPPLTSANFWPADALVGRPGPSYEPPSPPSTNSSQRGLAKQPSGLGLTQRSEASEQQSQRSDPRKGLGALPERTVEIMAKNTGIRYAPGDLAAAGGEPEADQPRASGAFSSEEGDTQGGEVVEGDAEDGTESPGSEHTLPPSKADVAGPLSAAVPAVVRLQYLKAQHPSPLVRPLYTVPATEGSGPTLADHARGQAEWEQQFATRVASEREKKNPTTDRLLRQHYSRILTTGQPGANRYVPTAEQAAAARDLNAFQQRVWQRTREGSAVERLLRSRQEPPSALPEGSALRNLSKDPAAGFPSLDAAQQRTPPRLYVSGMPFGLEHLNGDYQLAADGVFNYWRRVPSPGWAGELPVITIAMGGWVIGRVREDTLEQGGGSVRAIMDDLESQGQMPHEVADWQWRSEPTGDWSDECSITVSAAGLATPASEDHDASSHASQPATLEQPPFDPRSSASHNSQTSSQAKPANSAEGSETSHPGEPGLPGVSPGASHWVERIDPRSGRAYLYNKKTRKTEWTPLPPAPAAAAAAADVTAADSSGLMATPIQRASHPPSSPLVPFGSFSGRPEFASPNSTPLPGGGAAGEGARPAGGYPHNPASAPLARRLVRPPAIAQPEIVVTQRLSAGPPAIAGGQPPLVPPLDLAGWGKRPVSSDSATPVHAGVSSPPGSEPSNFPSAMQVPRVVTSNFQPPGAASASQQGSHLTDHVPNAPVASPASLLPPGNFSRLKQPPASSLKSPSQVRSPFSLASHRSLPVRFQDSVPTDAKEPPAPSPHASTPAHTTQSPASPSSTQNKTPRPILSPRSQTSQRPQSPQLSHASHPPTSTLSDRNETRSERPAAAVPTAKPASRAVQQALDSGAWRSKLDPKTDRVFYIHNKTKKTCWNLDKELARMEAAQKVSQP